MDGISTRRVVVEPGGSGVVAHVGLHALGAFADRLGLGDSLSSAIPWRATAFLSTTGARCSSRLRWIVRITSDWPTTAVALSADLLGWFQLLCLDGSWTDARPKALRWAILRALGRLVHRSRRWIVRIISDWPTTGVARGLPANRAHHLSARVTALFTTTLTTRPDSADRSLPPSLRAAAGPVSDPGRPRPPPNRPELRTCAVRAVLKWGREDLGLVG